MTTLPLNFNTIHSKNKWKEYLLRNASQQDELPNYKLHRKCWIVQLKYVTLSLTIHK